MCFFEDLHICVWALVHSVCVLVSERLFPRPHGHLRPYGKMTIVKKITTILRKNTIFDNTLYIIYIFLTYLLSCLSAFLALTLSFLRTRSLLNLTMSFLNRIVGSLSNLINKVIRSLLTSTCRSLTE